jgi:short-subunit dehydrogenase
VKDISGKMAVVCGAGSGMGRCISLDLAREGTNLILMDISGDALGNVAKEVEALGVEAHTFCLDATNWVQVKETADTIHARWGAVDILVNCVGMAHWATILDTTMGDWKKLFDVNLWTMIHTVKAFAPKMVERKSGQIVNFSSGQAFFAVPSWGAYACTKFAVDGYSEALRYELGAYGVIVSCVYPGIVRTPFYDNITGGWMAKGMMWFLLATAAKPETMSRMVVKGIKRRRRRVIPLIMLPVFVFRSLIPWIFDGVGVAIAWVLRKEKGPGPLVPDED